MTITMNHTGFVVENVERSLQFYRDGLGLDHAGSYEEVGTARIVGYDQPHLKGALLVASDGHYLELIEYVKPRGEIRSSEEQHKRAVVGASHLAFIVDDAEDMLERLVNNGGSKFKPVVELQPGVKACYLQDPDGNWIELLQDEDHSAQQFEIRQNTRIFRSFGVK